MSDLLWKPGVIYSLRVKSGDDDYGSWIASSTFESLKVSLLEYARQRDRDYRTMVAPRKVYELTVIDQDAFEITARGYRQGSMLLEDMVRLKLQFDISCPEIKLNFLWLITTSSATPTGVPQSSSPSVG